MHELVRSPRLKELAEELRASFDVVVYDLPGILEESYSTMLAPLGEVVLLTVCSGRTDDRQLDVAVKELREAGIQPAGVVFNLARASDAGASMFSGGSRLQAAREWLAQRVSQLSVSASAILSKLK
jgi:Mrp family chromosome partitioning ATPase